MPEELEGIYDSAEYVRQQAYQKENSRFATVSGGFSFAVAGVFLWYGGPGLLDALGRGACHRAQKNLFEIPLQSHAASFRRFLELFPPDAAAKNA